MLKIILAEAEHFLTLFLGFGRFSGWFSYNGFSYKKNVYVFNIEIVSYKKMSVLRARELRDVPSVDAYKTFPHSIIQQITIARNTRFPRYTSACFYFSIGYMLQATAWYNAVARQTLFFYNTSDYDAGLLF